MVSELELLNARIAELNDLHHHTKSRLYSLECERQRIYAHQFETKTDEDPAYVEVKREDWPTLTPGATARYIIVRPKDEESAMIEGEVYQFNGEHSVGRSISTYNMNFTLVFPNGEIVKPVKKYRVKVWVKS